MLMPLAKREEERARSEDAPVHELCPSLLALGVLHPVLVDLGKLFVRLLVELGERLHQVIVYFVVDRRQSQVPRVDAREQPPVRLRVLDDLDRESGGIFQPGRGERRRGTHCFSISTRFWAFWGSNLVAIVDAGGRW